VLIVIVVLQNAKKANLQANVRIVVGTSVAAIMQFIMVDNFEQYIVMGTIAAAVAIFVGTRIFLAFRK